MGDFGEVEETDQDQFNLQLAEYLKETDITYTLTAPVGERGHMPVGIVSANYNGPILMLGNMIWFHWSTNRNKYEAGINFLNRIRREYVTVMHNHMDDKKFYETIAKHGVIRQVGQLFDVYEDCPAQIWQTRKYHGRNS